MLKQYNSYIQELSQCDADVILDILEFKYKKFRTLYTILKEYTDYIISLSYDSSEPECSLTVEVTFNKFDNFDNMIHELTNTNTDGCNLKISSTGPDSDESCYLNISLMMNETKHKRQ